MEIAEKIGQSNETLLRHGDLLLLNAPLDKVLGEVEECGVR